MYVNICVNNEEKEKIMSKKVIYFIDGLYSAFSFSGKHTKITRRAKKYTHFSSNVNTNSSINLKKSIRRISISIEESKI